MEDYVRVHTCNYLGENTCTSATAIELSTVGTLKGREEIHR